MNCLLDLNKPTPTLYVHAVIPPRSPILVLSNHILEWKDEAVEVQMIHRRKWRNVKSEPSLFLWDVLSVEITFAHFPEVLDDMNVILPEVAYTL